MHNDEAFKDLFPALYKLNLIKEVIDEFQNRVDLGFYSRREQNLIGAEVTDRIREILAENLANVPTKKSCPHVVCHQCGVGGSY